MTRIFLHRMIKPLCVFLALAVLFSAFVAVVVRVNRISENADGNYDYSWNPPVKSSKSGLGYVPVCEDASAVLYVNYDTGGFYIYNRADGAKWYSTPQNTEGDSISKGQTRMEIQSEIVLEYINVEDENTNSVLQRTNSRIGCINNGGISVEDIKNGVRITYDFKEQEIRLCVEYTLENGSLKASVLLDRLEDGTKSYLVALNLLPYFGAAGAESSGYLFIPDGSGAVAEFNNGAIPLEDYEKAVYGADRIYYEHNETSLSENIIMPVFGTVHSGQKALMGIITEGEGGADIAAKIGSSKNYYNTVYTKMLYRIYAQEASFYKNNKTNSISTVTHTDFGTDRYTVSYTMLSGKKACYGGMAEKYRGYLEKEKGLRSSPHKPALAVDIYGAVKQRTSVFGISVDKTRVLTAFDRAEEMIKELKAAGVGRMAVRYIGWYGNGVYNSEVPDSAKPLSVLGGSKAFASLAGWLSENSCEFYPAADMVTFTKDSLGSSKGRYSAKATNGGNGIQYTYSPATFEKSDDRVPWMLVKPSLLNSVTQNFLDSYLKLDIGAVSLLEIGEYAYSDFARDQGVYKAGSIGYIEQMLKNAGERLPSLAVDNGNAYTLPYADRVFGLPAASSGYDIFTYDVPFVQMVLHGYVSYTIPYMRQSAEMHTTMLKAVENGSDLLFSCVSDDTYKLNDTPLKHLFSSELSLWKEEAVRYYSEYMSVAQLVWDSEITEHCRLEEDLFKTVYSNGTEIYVNYSDKAKTAEGTTVGALDYTVVKTGQ